MKRGVVATDQEPDQLQEKLDQFAAAALSGLVQSGGPNTFTSAQAAFDYAVAMILERDKRDRIGLAISAEEENSL